MCPELELLRDAHPELLFLQGWHAKYFGEDVHVISVFSIRDLQCPEMTFPCEGPQCGLARRFFETRRAQERWQEFRDLYLLRTPCWHFWRRRGYGRKVCEACWDKLNTAWSREEQPLNVFRLPESAPDHDSDRPCRRA